MNNVLKACQLELRFHTRKGNLNLEQLFSISLADLSDAIKNSHKILKESSLVDDLSFLDNTFNEVNPLEQLRFEVMKEVYQMRKSLADAQKVASETKAHNNKINAIIAQKQDNELAGMSVEDLKKLLK